MTSNQSLFAETLIVTATYNEMENLPVLIEKIQANAPGAHVLVIDDNSPDGTGRWAVERAKQDPGLTAIIRDGKQGLGSAIIAAMRFAIDRDYRFLINLDADLSHDPDVLPRLIQAMDRRQSALGRPGAAVDSGGSDESAIAVDRREGDPIERDPIEGLHDVVIGSRYVPGGGVSGWPLRRQLMSRAVNLYARQLLRLPLRDCSSGYRCFRVSKLRDIDLDSIRATGYAFHEEILFHLRCAGARFGETPIVFTDRRYGKSKINLREALIALRVILELAIRGCPKKTAKM